MAQFGNSVDAEEIGRFDTASVSWWDPAGSLAPLHRINPARLAFIRRQFVAHFGRAADSLSPFHGLALADLGCGGGLVAEPMARIGFRVTGIDASGEAVRVAREHAAAGGLMIDYRIGDATALAERGERFDAVLALEVIEHVANRDAFLAAVGALVKPGGVFIGATLNRTARSFALAVVGAEYILGWLPRGTHDWRRFVRPSEFVLGLREVGLATMTLTGLAYDVFGGGWRETQDLSVNYLLAAARR